MEQNNIKDHIKRDFRGTIENLRQHIIQLVAKADEMGLEEIDPTAYAALNNAECQLCI